jgi:hypothetical protein
MITQVVRAADDIGIHALHRHRYHRPGNQDAGAPDGLPLQIGLESHARDKGFVGIAAHTWRGKIEHETVSSGTEFDFKVALRSRDETFYHIVLPEVRHPCARWRHRHRRTYLMG